MEEYNVLVLMEKEKETGFFTQTVGSYKVDAGIRLVEGLYLQEEEDGHKIFLTLTTHDVEDWEYYGIYELYNDEIYEPLGIEVLDGSGEYNPRWILKFIYDRDNQVVTEILNNLIKLHLDELERIAPILIENKEKYSEENT